MHPAECIQWEYSTHPNASLLEDRCIRLLTRLRNEDDVRQQCMQDTRPAHRDMFRGLMRDEWSYLAGHYRGEDFYCLVERPVYIAGREGTRAVAVPAAMEFFHTQFIADLALLDALKADAIAPISQAEFDALLVELLVNSMVMFLAYHPYANGNGHIGRLFLWAGLARYGLWPRHWSLNRRPKWDALIRKHRDGDPKPLEKFVWKALR